MASSSHPTEADDLEAKDAFVADLPSTFPVSHPLRSRVKAQSDLTGMDLEAKVFGATRQKSRINYRSVSDISAMVHLSPDVLQTMEKRRRQRSSSDVLAKFGQIPLSGGDDLRLAEQVQAYGTRKERREAGITDEEIQGKIDKNEGVQPPDDFEFNHKGFTSQQAEDLLKVHGRNELPEKVTPKWLIFLRLFWAPMPIMIWLAIIIEAGIQNFLDMGILLIIQFTNASISFYETNKAGNAIAALKNSLKPTATCKRDGAWKNIDARELVPGDLVLLGSGSAIPADCRVNGGEIDVDQTALTGESLPVTFYKGDSCKMGSTVVRGEVEGTVEFTGANTFFGKTAALLKQTNEHSYLQVVLMTVMFTLVGLSIALCLVCFVYLLAKGQTLKEALSFTVVVLVASIPLAIEIVTTTTLAIGSKLLAKDGAIVAQLSSIERMASMSILCSDKTGTLTMNQMVIQDETPTYIANETQESVLISAALAAKWKEPPRDALDRLVLGTVDMSLMDAYEQLDYMPFDPQVKRTEGTIKHIATQKEFKTSKGAPHIILQLLDETDDDIKDQVEADVARLGALGIRSLAVARTDDNGKWRMLGLLTFLDPPRADTKQTIVDAHKYGVGVKMITGDHLLIARNTAAQLDLGTHIFTSEYLPLLDSETKEKPENLAANYGDLCLAADGFAQVYPEHKYLIVECLRELGYAVGMTGDGVNDAPALKRADVGIAVADSTDAARAAADIVLTQPGLSAVSLGIVESRKIFQRVNNFMTYRIAATLQLLVFFFVSILAFHPNEYFHPESEGEWPEFFQIPVILIMLITLLNDGTLITIAYDHAEARPTPCVWNLPALFLTSTTLGVVSCFSSLLLLHILLDSWNEDGFFQKIGFRGVEYGQMILAMYLKISVSDFLTLFSARTGMSFFYQIPPSAMLLGGGAFALFISSLLSVIWADTEIEEIPVNGLRHDMELFGFVWIYSFVFFIIQDVLKVVVFHWMYLKNFYNIASTGVVVLPKSAEKLIADMEAALGESTNKHH